tara:strand:- start:113 stop:283 length:171 start_codon:yes stop_codon:yes gene_type:complete
MQSLDAKQQRLNDKLDNAYDIRENCQRGTMAWMDANDLVEHLRRKLHKLNQRIARM